ncbi:MAG: hypothetical protein II670_07470, partial [Alphaproteobacteria bacterium]|nr:hypothetical protein [Alphaproteobacteria bacterium]
HSAFNTVSAFPDIYCEAVVPPHVESSSFQYIGDIYVPCGSKEAYKEAEYWRYYSYRIRCINAEPAYVETKEPTVNPSDVSVVISWRSEAYAQKYVINVTWNGKQFCTVTFDKNGNILTFDFNSNPESRSAELRAANATANGLQYKVTNLSENTEYAYTVSAINASDKVIKEYTGKFTTLGGADNVEEQLAENFSFDKSIVVNDKTISVVGKENSDICIYNIAGKQVTNPVPTAGVYVVTDGNNTSKILVK